MENFAVIDLGSNSARLSVTRIDDNGETTPVTQLKSYVRLSENMGVERVLQPEAIDRTLAALKEFKTVYDREENVSVKAIATAATRQASNQKQFLKQVAELGIDLKVIPGTTEAYYDYLASARPCRYRTLLFWILAGQVRKLFWCKITRCSTLSASPLVV